MSKNLEKKIVKRNTEKELKQIKVPSTFSRRLKRAPQGADPLSLDVPNICFSLAVPGDKRWDEWEQERRRRGFDNTELWNLDMTISRFILPRLKEFKDCTYGYPAKFKSHKEWDEILDKMIEAFELTSSDKSWYDLDKDKIIKEGLDLFREYFFALWY